MCCFRSYFTKCVAQNSEKLMPHILTVLESRPVDVLKASRKDVHRVTSLGRHQDFNFERLAEIFFQCIIFDFILPNICPKYQQVS